ncbi:MAG: translocation/assembly module TamB domain-containing protein, partial [Spirochaetaceae bacterium]|nr:translocation/assembly module TamB domain-containing protein [Spirochaetaceae bacterium]
EDSIISLGAIEQSDSVRTIPLFINMKFTSGKKVQFLWPSENLPILRATATQGQIINVTMDSLSDIYSVIGDVDIKYGSIYYFQKSFYLSEGTIGFNENESKFDPLLGFRAQIKEVDSSGEIVNITLIQDKLPISKFSPRFKSDPPLSDVEIFSILGSGVFATIGNEQIDLTSALILTGDLVAQFGIIQSFENKVEDVFKLDLFSIRTQVIQNILIDRFVDNSTIDNGVYLDSFGRYLDNTNLYLGKYFGNDIFLQGQLQISNQKVLDSGLLYASNKLFFESTISLEWKTPLFLLGFSIKPDFVDPVASIQNTSLALSWGYSY